MRTKQINITIPQDDLTTLAMFDELCKSLEASRSELLVHLMREYVASHSTQKGQDEPCEYSADDITPGYLL